MDAAARVGASDPRVLVTPMIEPGVETVVGVLRDRQFGPVVMFGLGGVLVEALDDVVFRVAPFDRRDAEARGFAKHDEIKQPVVQASRRRDESAVAELP
jgi:hypothetical protein